MGWKQVFWVGNRMRQKERCQKNKKRAKVGGWMKQNNHRVVTWAE